jgi:hypothetical protein
MKMTRMVVIGLLAFILTVVAHAQEGIAGKWQGETRSGTPLELDLTVKDTTLTGTLTRDGQPLTLADGKVSKNTFTFKATLNGQAESFSGEVSGDNMKVWMDRQGPEAAATLKRVKK